MSNQLFERDEIPYDDLLENAGITKQMFDDLPEADINTILSGECSPLLPVRLMCDDGQMHTAQTQFSFLRESSGRVVVLYYPKVDEVNAPFLDADSKQRLAAGKVVIVDTPVPDGSTEKSYLKMDPLTHQIYGKPVDNVVRFINEIVTRFALNQEEANQLKAGETVSFFWENEYHTCGVDPQCSRPLRSVAGDEEDWKDNGNRKEAVRYEPGLDGCWVIDTDGNYIYVAEEDYDDDIEAEIDKRRMKSAQSVSSARSGGMSR